MQELKLLIEQQSSIENAKCLFLKDFLDLPTIKKEEPKRRAKK
jgi:hypothetical protein